jgi:hypothetical protein
MVGSTIGLLAIMVLEAIAMKAAGAKLVEKAAAKHGKALKYGSSAVFAAIAGFTFWQGYKMEPASCLSNVPTSGTVATDLADRANPKLINSSC